MRNKKNLFTGILLTLVSVHALAHSGATGIVKKRMELMKDTGSQMKIIGEMIRGKTSFDAGSVKDAAINISRHASEIEALFPEGSNHSPSEALPAIWNDWDGFISIANEMRTEADQLSLVVTTVSSVDEIKAQFGKIGKTCSGCHEKYRMKK